MQVSGGRALQAQEIANVNVLRQESAGQFVEQQGDCHGVSEFEEEVRFLILQGGSMRHCQSCIVL